MNKISGIFKGDAGVWIVFFALIIISVVEVFSATSTLTYKENSFMNPILNHGKFLFIGIIVVLIVHNIPFNLFKIVAPTGLLFSAVLLVLMLCGIGVRLNDATRWFRIMNIPIQPSEIAKGSLVIMVAQLLAMFQTEKGADKRAFYFIMPITAVVCGLILPENFSTAVILFGVIVLLMFIGRVPSLQLGKLLGIIAVAGGLAIGGLMSVSDSQARFISKNIPLGGRVAAWHDRLETFFDGSKNSEDKPEDFDLFNNAQVGHAKIAIASSNVIGCGPGNSVQRDFLSQAYSDFIYAIIVEELGLVGATITVLLYVVLLYRVERIARRCRSHCFPAFLIIGLALLMVCQAFVNMMVTTGLFPVTGQPLPLVSRGGTSTLINCAYFGMILSVSRYAAREEKQRKSEALAAQNTPTEGYLGENGEIPPAEKTAKEIEQGIFD